MSRKKENRFRLGLEHPYVGCCRREFYPCDRIERNFRASSELVATSSSSPRLNPQHAAKVTVS